VVWAASSSSLALANSFQTWAVLASSTRLAAVCPSRTEEEGEGIEGGGEEGITYGCRGVLQELLARGANDWSYTQLADAGHVVKGSVNSGVLPAGERALGVRKFKEED
jgi:hypothetical protein